MPKELPTDRIRSLATRSRFRIGGQLVQPDRLVISRDGREVTVEPRMMEVLVALAEHAGEVVSAEQLLIEVWRGTFYGDNPVHKAIAYLRRVLGDDLKSPRYIETIRKRGYRLIASVSYPDDYRRPAARASTWQGTSPYVGLAAFDDAHAGVFFGRSRTTAELLAAMRHQIDNQRRFVLIVGASGCGKSSLLNAGAIPLLRQDGGFDGLHALAIARCDLAGSETGDAMLRLAVALSTWTLGERPLFAPQPPAGLATLLRSTPESIGAIVEDALRRHASRDLAAQPHAHLLLVIDHAEALVATRARKPERDSAFAKALHHLCETPRVLVAMIVRSDFHPLLIETYPIIAERKLGEGHFDVLTPRAGQISQIIRAPAALAGLSFEEHPQTAECLDDLLRDAATEHVDALPLLQHTLQALYERRSDDGELGFEAYRAIGGLEGAIAHRAEEVFATLDEAAQRSLDRLLPLLVVLREDSEAVSARRVAWSALDGDARALAEAFVRARLFVGELSDGEPGVRVAHEALLRQWPRARDWLHDNRRLLQARARMRRAAARWMEEGRNADLLLNPGRPLQEALEAARQPPCDLSPEEHLFLEASTRQDRRRRRLRAGGIAGLALSAVIAATFAVIASQARSEAERRREEALQLSDFMLVDLAEKLRPLGNLGLLDSIGTKALAQLESRPEAQMRTADLVNRSRALRTVGEVMLGEGRLREAESAFVRAVEAARSATAVAPDAIEAQAEMGIAAYWLGLHHYRQRRFEQARAHWTLYLRTSERLVALQPRNTAWRIELSYALNNLGAVARDQGRTGEALGYFRRSARIKSDALATRPDDDALRYDLVDTLSWISSVDESEGRLRDASAGYSEQIGMLRRLVANKPDALLWQRRLATSLLSCGALAASRGLLDDAKAQIDEAIALLSRLTAREPGNQGWAHDLALAHVEASEIAWIRGEDDSHRSHARIAETLIRDIEASSQPTPAVRRLKAALRLVVASHPASATTEAGWDEVVAAFEDIASRSKHDLQETSALAKALVARGRQHADAGRAEAARRDWQRAIALLAVPARTSANPTVIAPWVGAHALLGEGQRVQARIAWLAEIGYRDAAYIASLGDVPALPTSAPRRAKRIEETPEAR